MVNVEFIIDYIPPPLVVVVCDVLEVESLVGATGDIGEDVVLSSVVVVVDEDEGISLLLVSLAQPARAINPTAAREISKGFFMVV